MKNFILVISTLILTQIVFGQEDTTFLKKIQIIEEVSVNANGQSVFEVPNINLIDFYIGAQGKFLLLKGKGNYFISELADDLSLNSSLLLTFKPEKIIEDCLGNLQIISSDSIYRIDQSSLEIELYEPHPIAFYYDYFANCAGETNQNLLYYFLSNSNQTITFNSIDKELHLQKTFYEAQDTIEVLVANDWEKQIIADRYDPNSQMGEITIAQLYANRAKFQRLMFYNFVISKLDYNPLFTVNNEVYIFDHYIDTLLTFDGENLNLTNAHPIAYHKIKGWQKEILFDEVSQNFYTTFLFNGSLYISELSKSDFSIVKSVQVKRNSFPKRLMVYNGFVYYDYKTTTEDSFIKLCRQRIQS